ncbi:MAG TPA: hypothetical protein VEI96_00780 [Thermodesulfovibrionales bacterium]|nr:hypothetical protein [Thermodesulfovibrionales bacterium]
MANLKETLVILKKPDGETVVIRDPDFVSYPDASQPYWSIVKENNEIRTTGEVWVEKGLKGDEVFCEDSVICTGVRCFHKLPHPQAKDCGSSCELDRAANCRPYRI